MERGGARPPNSSRKRCCRSVKLCEGCAKDVRRKDVRRMCEGCAEGCAKEGCAKEGCAKEGCSKEGCAKEGCAKEGCAKDVPKDVRRMPEELRSWGRLHFLFF